ncbi:MAG: pyridoxal phosphate-dependent aminotransferase [Armatimonadota bacterium]|nr:pyridoxal phosphate-dependent aminotransferase [Armatimonadota bacterium]MDR7528308.1 pyridoxal phosphate-dependent aminotransferase [Armatimonadota bacterium]MDR7543701.1 pyridoxal phosphate-dependent aminotransferase [Armatimonadota bacterium]MDR7573747.1 pyridoxal phosphate-dependent aminotransferase [Armatimonadota bacterium]MDR7584669.1 pyridoxal phosphate-dependent aminotransferase [Armatimonadota bacterium]
MTVTAPPVPTPAEPDPIASTTPPLPPHFAIGADLSGDHPLFPIPPEALRELAAALDRSETHYTDVMGVAPLRAGVARLLGALGLGIRDPATILVSSGEQESRFLALQTLSRAGRALLLPAVVHPGAWLAARVVPGGRIERLPVDETLTPTQESVRAAFARHASAALYLEVPNRFTGRAVASDRFAALLQEVQRADGMMVVDAGIAPWLPPSLVPAPLADSVAAERIWLLGSLCPGTGVDGWQIGYLAVPPEWIGAARSLKQIIAICTSVPVQWAAVGALQAAGEVHAARRETLRQLRADALRHLPQSEVLPGDAATVLAIRYGSGKPPALPFVAASGEAFGLPGALRLTITPSGEAVAAAALLARGSAVQVNPP